MHFTIPEFLKHLPVDGRGYPIPFFVAIVKGKPDFRLLDQKKQRRAFYENLCGICGKELDAIAYSISGPLGVKNAVSQDPLLHKGCAEFSLQACPHLHLQKADRRETGEGYDEILKAEKNSILVKEKPSEIYMCMVMNWVIINYKNQNMVLKFDVKQAIKYEYINGILQKS